VLEVALHRIKVCKTPFSQKIPLIYSRPYFGMLVQEDAEPMYLAQCATKEGSSHRIVAIQETVSLHSGRRVEVNSKKSKTDSCSEFVHNKDAVTPKPFFFFPFFFVLL
jgi:hypothetical protein